MTKKKIIEIKCTKKLSFTSQLRDYARYAKEQGKEFVLYIEEGMDQLKDLSGPLRKQIKLGNIILKTYKFTPA